MEKQTAGRKALGDFAPQFAALNDDVLFGEVWAKETELSLFSVKQFSSFSSSKFPIVIVGKSPLSAGLVRKQVPLLHPAA